MRIILLMSGMLLSLLSWGITPLATAAQSDALDAFVKQSPQIITASHQLSIENTRNILLKNKLAALEQQIAMKLGSVTPALLKRADLTVILAQADVESVNLALSTVEQDLNLIQDNKAALLNQLHTLVGTIADSSKQTVLQTQIDIQQQLQIILANRIKILQETQLLTQQTVQTALQWQSQLQSTWQTQQQQLRQKALDQLAFNLQQEQQSWLQRLAQLNQQLQTSGAYSLLNNNTYTDLEISILEAEERSSLSQLELELAKVRNDLANLGINASLQYSPASLNNLDHQTDRIIVQLTTIKNTITNKITLLQKRTQIILHGLQAGVVSDAEGNDNLSTLYNLSASYQKQLTNAIALSHDTEVLQKTIAQQLARQIASRQNLPGFDRHAWLVLGRHLLEIPRFTLQALQNLQRPLLTAKFSMPLWQRLGWTSYALAWLVLWYWLRRCLIIGTLHFEKLKQSVLTSNLFLVCLRLLQRHLAEFMLLGLLLSLPNIMGVPFRSFAFVISIVTIIFGFRLVTGFARILLLENVTEKNGHDVQLYHRLKWALLLGGLVTTFTVLVHQLPVAFSVQDLFDRLFMLFLLIVALVLLRACNIVPTLLAPYLEDKRPYLKQVVRLLSILIPLTLLSNALVGLVGYVVLAWSIVAYQGLSLVVLTGYLIARGILGELMSFIADKMIRHLRNGWLWSEALLKPCHQLLKIAVFIGAIAVLFKLYDWDSQSWPVIKLREFLGIHLFSFAGSSITPVSLVELFFILAALIWATRWTREFAYRWVFARTKDLGLRNSLAVFSQYLIVAVGILVALKVIGINLTALTVVASAFAFSIGLGLRDLANNFMCGILLLIERPVHIGNYVTMGNLDGEVVHIGMRAVTIITDDHQEMMIPNALIFSQPFINWTHHDNVVRIPITIKTTRADDPHHVRELVLDVLRNMPKILTTPAPDVHLKDMDEMLLKFEIEYYVDLHAIKSRSIVRSQFLLALWDRFKAEGIHAPEYPHEIIMLNSPQPPAANPTVKNNLATQ